MSLETELRTAVKKAVSDKLQNGGIDSLCPYCKEEIQVRAGVMKCPVCGGEFQVSFDVNL